MTDAAGSETTLTGRQGGESRDPRLDGLRGIAILPVVIYHLTFFGLAEGPFDRAITFLPSLGWTSVDLFFVLSGYLITGILLRARGGASYFSSFYARRALRIFPLYYAVLVFFFVIVPRLDALWDPSAFWVGGSEGETLWYWLYLENLRVAFTGSFNHHFLGIVWTLCIEEQFYLLWPVVVLLATRERLVRICLGLMVGAFVLRIVLVWLGAPSLTVLTLTPCRIDTLAAGALLAVWMQDGAIATKLRDAARWVLPIAALVWLGVVLYARHETAVVLPAGQVPSPDERAALAMAFTRSGWVQTLGYEADLFFYAALLVIALSTRGVGVFARVLSSGFLRSFGRTSYAIYLLHLFVAELARPLYDPQRTSLPFVVEQMIWWAVALSLIWGVAWMSWVFFESPILRLKRHFPMPPPAGPAASLPVGARLE
ncbi:O-acetyltransferase OatA [Myxococcaceae bacterium]|jgi:peptidoglycan/LPS O-acetylase OafA/YrhL|nr:O-acetyltransferase OatA [Myxococcaceae bacterium]